MSVEEAKAGAIAAWRARRAPEATVAREFPGNRSDGYLRDTWVQYAYRYARHAFARWAQRIAPNAWMRERWPELPAEGYTPPTYLRANYGHARAAHDNTATLIEGQARQAAELSAIRHLLGQLLDRAGSPVDMAAVESAARAGAQEALSRLDVRVEISPAAEPTGLVDELPEGDEQEADPA